MRSCRQAKRLIEEINPDTTESKIFDSIEFKKKNTFSLNIRFELKINFRSIEIEDINKQLVYNNASQKNCQSLKPLFK